MKQQRRIHARTYTSRYPPGEHDAGRTEDARIWTQHRRHASSSRFGNGMLRHDANRITGRHSDIRCTATTGIKIGVWPCSWRAHGHHCMFFFGGRAMGCRFPVHEQVRLHGGTRLEGMIRIDGLPVQ